MQYNNSQPNVLEEFQDTYEVYYRKAKDNPNESTRRECQRFINQSKNVIQTMIDYKKNLNYVKKYQQQKGVTAKLIKSNLEELQNSGLIKLNSNSLRHKCFIDVTLAMFWDIYNNQYCRSPDNQYCRSPDNCFPIFLSDVLPATEIAPQPEELNSYQTTEDYDEPIYYN